MSEIEERRLASLLKQKTLHKNRCLESLKTTKVPIDWIEIGDYSREISKEVTGAGNSEVDPKDDHKVNPEIVLRRDPKMPWLMINQTDKENSKMKILKIFLRMMKIQLKVKRSNRRMSTPFFNLCPRRNQD